VCWIRSLPDESRYCSLCSRGGGWCRQLAGRSRDRLRLGTLGRQRRPASRPTRWAPSSGCEPWPTSTTWPWRVGPDRRFTAEYGAEMAPYVDEYVLQVQRLQADPQSALWLCYATNPGASQGQPTGQNCSSSSAPRAPWTICLQWITTLRQDIDGVSISPFGYPAGGSGLCERLQAMGGSTPAPSPQTPATDLPSRDTPTAMAA